MNDLVRNKKRNSEVELTDEQREFFRENYFNNEYMNSNLTVEQVEELHPMYRFKFFEDLQKKRYIEVEIKQKTEQLQQLNKRVMKFELSVIRGDHENY